MVPHIKGSYSKFASCNSLMVGHFPSRKNHGFNSHLRIKSASLEYRDIAQLVRACD